MAWILKIVTLYKSTTKINCLTNKMNKAMRNKTKFPAILVLFLITIYGSNLHAQTPGYSMLERETSARASALAGAFTGVYGDAQTLFYNPAGIMGSKNKSIGFTLIDDILDLKAGNFVYSNSLNKTTKYAFGANYVNYGEFEGRDIFGNDTGTFSANDLVLAGGIAKEYSTNLFWGVSAKYLFSNIEEYSSSVMLADAGVIYRMPAQKVTVGLTLSNAGWVISKYAEMKDDPPTSIKAGISKSLAHAPVTVFTEYRSYFEGDDRIAGGMEVDFSDKFTGRIGYNSYGADQKVGDDNGTLAGASIGFGFKWKEYLIDYAFNSLGALGNQNRLTVFWVLNQ